LNNDLPGYSLKETIFTNTRTRIQRALCNENGCPVIIKSFENRYPSPRQRQCFLLSYELLKKFNHPNITKALDYQEQDGLPVMVLEDKQSIDLRQYIQALKGKPVPIEQFLNIAIQLADALSVIHHSQVIHKDLHPGNILINPATCSVQISDFGLASLLSREQTTLVPAEQLEGVLAYISPEQTGRMNRSLDYRSDFYTLGVTFYELLSGELPFSSQDALGMVHAHIAKVHKPLTQCREDIPPTLSSLIDKLLNKAPEQRYKSAIGLKKDLEKCLVMCKTQHAMVDFQLGSDDRSDRFQIPQILYGREAEVKLMMDCFEQAALGRAKLLNIAGYSGVGKSALVHEVHQSIAAHRGLFIAGKFDQFQRTLPYSALKQALKSWLFYALSQNESDLQAMRQNLNQELGVNARVLLDFMVEFIPLLGDLPEVPVLEAKENLNRFNIVFQKFIKLICQHRPLVLFIDDLQWADHGTLNLLPLLLEEGRSRILVITAYRDNEVDQHHPAIQALNEISEQDRDKDLLIQKVSSIQLQALNLKHTQQLLVDALHRPLKELRPLAELLQFKTAGNPFFINEFLKTLYHEGLINFNLQHQRWEWDVKAINEQDISDNVVELMLGKMKRLPAETQAIMQLAACVGSRFDLEMLALIQPSSLECVNQILWPAVQEGLILQEGGGWQLGGAVMPQEGGTYRSSISPHCKFLHDRMLEAAYGSLSDEKRQSTHLKIGRLLRDAMLGEQQPSEYSLPTMMLFSVLGQLNHASILITQVDERLQLASLNFQAAERAKLSGVWALAVTYAAQGMTLLPDDAWKSQYALCYQLHLLRIECESLNSNLALANQLSETVLKQVGSKFEKATICLLQLKMNVGGKRLNWALGRGMQGLRYCGIDVPEIAQINQDLVNSLETELNKKLQLIDLKSLISCSNKKIPEELELTCSLFVRINAYSQIAGLANLYRYSNYRAMDLVLGSYVGKHAISIFGLNAVLLTKQKRYTEARQFAEAGMQLAKHYPKFPGLPVFYNGLGSMQWFYTAPYSQAIKIQQKAYDFGLEFGEVMAGVLAGSANVVVNQFVMGEALVKVSKKILNVQELLVKYDHKIAAGAYYARLVDALMQSTESLRNLSNPLDISTFLPDEWQLIQSCALKSFIEHLQVQWFFWSDQDKLAWQAVKTAEPSVELMSGFITPLEHRFLAALLACQRYPSANESEQEALSDYIASSREELDTLSELCPENFEHKLLLLKAEQACIQNDDMAQVLGLYEQAIQSARAGGYLQYHGLANERCASYWLVLGFDVAARRYLQQAIYVYQQWGCELKCSMLQQKYARLLAKESYSSETSHSQSTRSEMSIASENRSELGLHGFTGGLDFESVMEAAQQISGELDLRELLIKSLSLIKQSTGAQTAALIMKSDIKSSMYHKGAVVEACLVGAEKPTKREKLGQCQVLPVTVIDYVLNNKANFNLAQLDELKELDLQKYQADPYVTKYQPKSMLCMPVVYRDKVIGALYLDCCYGKNGFTAEHLRVLEMLLSQAVISFENARLYGKSERVNKTLEKKIAVRSQALEKSNFDLQAANDELQSFSYSVSHDLRAPLRSIIGFSEILLEDYTQALDEMGVGLLHRITDSAKKMSELILSLLELSQVQNSEIDLKPVNLSALAQSIAKQLNQEKTGQPVLFTYVEPIVVPGDENMFRSVMENLLNNAWKYSSKEAQAEVEFGVKRLNKQTVYFIKDNGAGFDMSHAQNLFVTFKRLHLEHEFSGTGVGLSTVQRIIHKHAGKIWAEAEIGKGATFYFTLWTEDA